MRRAPALLAPGLILAFACALAWPLVLQGRIPINGDWLLCHFDPWRTEGPRVAPQPLEPDDPVNTLYPLRLEAARQWRQGCWPLWTPRVLCGTPLAADGTALPYSPFILLWLFLPGPWAWSAELLMQLVVAGGGAYAFARSMGCGRAASLVGAFAFMGHQGIVLCWELRFVLGAFCWMPWMLWACQRYRVSGRRPWLAAAALATAAAVTSGSPQFAAYVVGAGLLLTVLFPAPPGRRWAPVAALLLGLAVAAVQWLPTLALGPASQRTPDRYAGLNVLPPWHLATFLAPECFGHVATGDFLGGALTRPSMVLTFGGYLGLLPLGMALAALASGRAGRTLALTGLGIVAGLLALGLGPVQALLKALCPWVDGFDQVRALLAASGCLALAVPFGSLSRIPRGWAAWAAAAALGLLGWALVLAWSGRGWLPSTAGDFWARHHLPSLVGMALALAVFRLPGTLPGRAAVLLAALDLAWFAQGYNPFVPPERLAPETPLIAALRASAGDGGRIVGFDPLPPGDIPAGDAWRLFKGDCLPPAVALLYEGLSDLRGKNSLYPARTGMFMAALAGAGRAPPFLSALHLPATASPLLDAASVSGVLSPVPLEAPRFERLAASGSLGVYRNTRALPRARLLADWRVLEPGALWRALALGRLDPAREALLEEDPGLAPSDRTLQGGVRILREAPDRLDLEAEASGPCLLVLADTWDAGWEARVDGEPAPVLRAYGNFRALALREGRHRVGFRYRPASFLLGLSLSLLGLLGCLWILIRRD